MSHCSSTQLPRSPPHALLPHNNNNQQVQYCCKFGQRLALISSSHAWEASAAQHMAWSEGDVWSAVASVPVG
jgi:hypothetical protein